MSGPNAKAALVILVIGVVLSLPPLTELIWAKRVALIASVFIFVVAHTAAAATLVLAGEVRKLEGVPVPLFRPSRTLFMLGVAAYHFYLVWAIYRAWTIA